MVLLPSQRSPPSRPSASAPAAPSGTDGRTFKDESGHTAKETEWHRVTCFGGLARSASLALAELFIRERRVRGASRRWLAAAVPALATAMTALGTWYFAVDYWVPGMAGQP